MKKISPAGLWVALALVLTLSIPAQAAPPPTNKATAPIQSPQTQTSSYSTVSEDVKFQNKDVTLGGTLVRPQTSGPVPAIIFIHGSGPETRQGSRAYAEFFARQGVAGLVYDKRGTGSSTGNWVAASYYDLADDALAALNYLKTRPDINPRQIGLWGGSQGGWVAPIAATRSPEVAFLVVVAAPLVDVPQDTLYQYDLLYRNLGYSQTVVDLNLKAWKYILDNDLQVQRKALPLPYRTTLVSANSQPLNWNPLLLWEQIKIPVLAIWGEKDQNVPVQDSAARLSSILTKAGNKDFTTKIFPNADHTLNVPGSAAKAPGYFETEINWVVAHTSGTLLPATDFPVLTNPILNESGNFLPGGRYMPAPWYGGALFQTALQLIFLLVFLSTFLLGAVNSVVRLARSRKSGLAPAKKLRLARLLAWAVSLLGLALLVANYLLLPLSEKAYNLPPLVAVLPLLGCLYVLLALATAYYAVRSWKNKIWSQAGRIHFTVVSLVAAGFIWYLAYWSLIGWLF